MAKATRVLQFKVLIEQDEDGLYVASGKDYFGKYFVTPIFHRKNLM